MRPNVNIASEGREKEVIVVIFTHCLLNPLLKARTLNLNLILFQLEKMLKTETMSSVDPLESAKEFRRSRVLNHTLRAYISKLYKIES